jgi:hypothetical protein
MGSDSSLIALKADKDFLGVFWTIRGGDVGWRVGRKEEGLICSMEGLKILGLMI